MADELNPCPECKNEYLAIRTDIYKDKREFIYCDCCGCIAPKSVWNLIGRTASTEASAQTKPLHQYLEASHALDVATDNFYGQAQPSDQQKHVMPPMRGTGSQHDASASVLTVERILQLVCENTGKRINLCLSELDEHIALARSIEVELASRCRAQGGITKLDFTDYTTPVTYSNGTGRAAPAERASESVSEDVQVFAIEVEKMLCKALGREWSAAGISIESLIGELGRPAAAPSADNGEKSHAD